MAIHTNKEAEVHVVNKSKTHVCYIGFGILSVSHVSTTYQYNSACGKREAHHNWSMVVHEEAAPAPGTTLMTSGPVRPDSSAVNAIGTQIRDLINPGLTQWRLVFCGRRRGKR